METNYGSNSNRSKAEQPKEVKKVEKVVTGEVKKKKRNKFADAFIKEDFGDVKDHVIMDIVIPSVKNLFIDTVTNSLSMLLNGEVRGNGAGRRAPNVSYSSYSRNPSRPVNTVSRSAFNFDDIIFSSRGDAENVLNMMFEILDAYSQVRVADFYELSGCTGDHTDNNYGWTNLQSAEVIRDREGYIIKLPRPVPLNR